MAKKSVKRQLIVQFWVKIPIAILTAVGMMIVSQRLLGLSDSVALSLMGTTLFVLVPSFVAEYQVRHAKLESAQRFESIRMDAESRRSLPIHAKNFALLMATALAGYAGLYALLSGRSTTLGIVSLVVGVVVMVPLASGWRTLFIQSDL